MGNSIHVASQGWNQACNPGRLIHRRRTLAGINERCSIEIQWSYVGLHHLTTCQLASLARSITDPGFLLYQL